MTPVERIVDWVKNKPVWWRHAIRLSLRDGELTQSNLDEIYLIAKMEHDLVEKDESFGDAQSEVDTAGFELEEHEVTLESISSVLNIGVLAGGQFLGFPKNGLTVVYGDNGAGKSSYARVLKHACLARGAPPEILGNVFDKNSGPASASITVMAGGKSEPKDWSLKAKSDNKLKAIRVFDGEVSDNFVSDEDELSYKPLGLYLLDDLAKAIDHVKRNVTEETMGTNGLFPLPKFSSTKAGSFVLSLNTNAKVEDVKNYVATDDDLTKKASLQKEINDLRAKSPEQLRKDLKNREIQLNSLKTYLTTSANKLSDSEFNNLLGKWNDYKSKERLANELRNRVLKDLPISEIGGAEWQSMWVAAEKFLKDVAKKDFPPKQGEDCPLCLQVVNEESANKLTEFKEYLLDKTSQEAKNSQADLRKLKEKVNGFSFDITPYAASINIANELEDGIANTVEKFHEEIISRHDVFKQEVLPEAIEHLDDSLLKKLEDLIQGTERYIDQVADEKEAAKSLAKKEQEMIEISDKEQVKEYADKIESNILRYQALKKYEMLQSQCNTRSVTDVNADICKKEVIQPVVDNFEVELKSFGFDRFKVEPKTKGRAGAQLLRLEISNSGEPLVAKVASEGEQRCIAIACFLAELKADRRKSAAIFDDPVNSLSHRWSAKIAKRLVEESLQRQIVVLTHDIAFYKYLLEETEKHQDASFNGICLERSRKFAGIVRKTPPWDALTTSSRIKELRRKLGDLKKVYSDGTEQEFRIEAYHFYGYLREAWERLVEEKLLNKVVTRFGRGVETNRLKRLLDLTVDDFKRIEEGMSKCSTYFRGHDSAPAVGDPYPTIAEVEADLKSIDDFNTELQTTRKRS